MSGWRSNPALPGGLVYEGQHGGRPQQLYGGTGAQSAALHALDAALGIEHEECSWLKAYLLDMRAHMPPPHRQFVAGLEAAPSLRAAVEAAGGRGELREAYNDCVQELERFRLQHKAFAFNYIAKHNKAAEKGTGGSDFMPALQVLQTTLQTQRATRPAALVSTLPCTAHPPTHPPFAGLPRCHQPQRAAVGCRPSWQMQQGCVIGLTAQRCWDN